MSTYRTPETQKRYQEYQKKTPVINQCYLCNKPALKEFTHWRIVENSFPYDLIAEMHHMIIPRRHVVEADLTDEELQEFKKIKLEEIEPSYDYIMEATTKTKSIPSHFHLHVFVAKKMY